MFSKDEVGRDGSSIYSVVNCIRLLVYLVAKTGTGERCSGGFSKELGFCYKCSYNGKLRKKKIFQPEQEEGTIVEQENLKVYITEYYRKLFGDPEPNVHSMMEEHDHNIPQLSE